MENGQTFAGKYQLLGPLGKGGMGTVFEAIHLASGQAVALKLITGVEINDEVLLRFIREAEAAERINSPNVVRIFDLGSDLDTGIPYMAMEKLSGTDVSHLLRGLGALPPNTAAKIAAQAAAGLARAHEMGIVHRDIKPGNLFIAGDEQSDECTVKVLDFGIAKLTQDQTQDREELTQTGSVLGSPHYMSPEQAQGLKSIDARSDIWSLGIVLYKMLCGKAPHADLDALGQIILAICSKPATPVQVLAPWVPPGLAQIVARCLQIEPGDRYANALELEAALAQFLGPDRRLYADDLRAVNDADRMYVAPSVLDVDPGSFSTQHSLELSSPALMQRPRGKAPLILGGLAVAAAAVGVTVFAMSHSEGADPSSLTAELPPTNAQPVPSTVIIDRIELRDVRVAIAAPAGAQVFVAGKLAELDNGTLVISGSLGSEHEVRVIEGGREKREVVTIAESGAKPDRITLAEAPSNNKSSSSSSSHSSHGSTTPAASAPVKQPTKPTKPLKSTTDFE